jgi:hypothetical protein
MVHTRKALHAFCKIDAGMQRGSSQAARRCTAAKIWVDSTLEVESQALHPSSKINKLHAMAS